MKNNLLILEPIGGISGDMTVAMLIDLGVPIEYLRSYWSYLAIPHCQIDTFVSKKNELHCVRFTVNSQWTSVSPEEMSPKKLPSMALSKAPSNAPSHTPIHTHRPYREIRQLLNNAQLPKRAQDTALRIFAELAEAEAQVHACTVEEVEFHEVGSWDSITDVICIALGLDYLGITDIFVHPIPLGSGLTKTAHGNLPIPAPATLNLLSGFTLLWDQSPMERTTPTGAAFLKACAKRMPDHLTYRLVKVGVGGGERNSLEFPNILRGQWGEVSEGLESDTKLPWQEESLECAETNLDDCSAEWIGHLCTLLLTKGALDVWCSAAQMKKNRPAVVLHVLYPKPMREELLALLFQESTTLGVRYSTWQRLSLPREIVQLASPWGIVRGKKSVWKEQVRFHAEFDDCQQIALKHQLPLRDVVAQIENLFFKAENENNFPKT